MDLESIAITRRSDISQAWTLQPNRLFAFAGDGKTFASGNYSKAADAWVDETATLKRLQTHHNDGSITELALSEHGEHLALISAGGGANQVFTLSLRNAKGGQTAWEHTLVEGDSLAGLAFSKDSRFLAVGSVEKQQSSSTCITVFETMSGKQVHKFVAGSGRKITGVAFSPEGSLLATAGMDKTVRVWNLASGQPCLPVLHTSAVLTALAFSPDQRRLAGAGYDNHVRLWETEAGNELLILRSLGKPGNGQYGFTARVLFSPDGHRLMSNNWDGTINLWDANDTRLAGK